MDRWYCRVQAEGLGTRRVVLEAANVHDARDAARQWAQDRNGFKAVYDVQVASAPRSLRLGVINDL